MSAGANCTISVTFKPAAGGTRTGALSISDNALGSPQSVALSGTGQDFTFTASSGSSTSATVAPGQAATYTLSVGGEGGMSGTVSLYLYRGSLRGHLHGFAEPANGWEFCNQCHGHCHDDRPFGQRRHALDPFPPSHPYRRA